MSFGGMNHGQGPSQPMSDINVTPLVDVLLVLLIIMMVTAPLLTQAVKVDLPKARAQALAATQKPIQLSIDQQGQLFLDAQAVTLADAEQQLRERYPNLATLAPADQPTIQLAADGSSRYQQVAEVMAMVKQVGFSKLAFIMQPPRSAAS